MLITSCPDRRYPAGWHVQSPSRFSSKLAENRFSGRRAQSGARLGGPLHPEYASRLSAVMLNAFGVMVMKRLGSLCPHTKKC